MERYDEYSTETNDKPASTVHVFSKRKRPIGYAKAGRTKQAKSALLVIEAALKKRRAGGVNRSA